ncbi:MAG: hypothetical protein HY748_02295 [Elusimicrobia bacterium]|nr:hypothetical protein [Elusimicrobiota bacterium]
MTRKALFLPVLSFAFFFQAWAQDQPPTQSPSPVARIFLNQLKGLDAAGRKAAGTCEDLRRCAGLMSKEAREAARNELFRLEGRTKGGGLLTEISQGFIALGFPQDAVRMLRMSPFDSGGGQMLSQAAGEFHNQGKYDLAMAAAQEALKIDPSDEAALAVLRLSERKVHKREIASLPVKKDSSVDAGPDDGAKAQAFVFSQAGAASQDASRRSAWPLPPTEVYHMPGTKPPSTWDTIVTGVGSLWKVYNHEPTPQERAVIDGLKMKLNSLPSGKDLVREMGGWDRIDKEVYFMVTEMSNDGTAAYVRPMTPWEVKKKGKNFVLAINKKLMEDGPETVMPVFGHELQHVADKLSGHAEYDLAVTSEHGAHLRQSHLFQQVDKGLSPERRKELEKKPAWLYQKWVTSMWEDRLLKLYPKKEDYQKVFQGSKNLQYVAGLAYDDIYKKAVKDGSPQVMYHVSDLYANATHEPEVTESGLLAKIKAEKNPVKRGRLESLLKELREMRRDIFRMDDSYRARTGQTLP